VLSGRGLCDELITRPEESYQLSCIIVCDLETSRLRRPWSTLGHNAIGGGGTIKTNIVFLLLPFAEEPYFLYSGVNTDSGL